MTKPNTAIVDGARAFYDSAGRLAAKELPDVAWPAFDGLTKERLSAWMLAYSATIEVSVRMTDALLSLGVDEERL